MWYYIGDILIHLVFIKASRASVALGAFFMSAPRSGFKPVVFAYIPRYIDSKAAACPLDYAACKGFVYFQKLGGRVLAADDGFGILAEKVVSLV